MTLTVQNFIKPDKPWGPCSERVRVLTDKLSNRGYNPLIYRQDIIEEAPDATARVGLTDGPDVFDGTSAAAKVDVVSTSADDASAGTGCQSVGLFGIADGGAYAVEIITMNGTTAVTSTTDWIRVICMRINAAGTGKTVAGAITVHETGGATETYLTINIGDFESHNSTFWVADGYYARTGDTDTEYYKAPSAAGVDIDAGSVAHVKMESGSITYEFLSLQYVTMPLSGAKHINAARRVTGDDGSAYLELQHASINTAANASACYSIQYIVWGAL